MPETILTPTQPSTSSPTPSQDQPNKQDGSPSPSPSIDWSSAIPKGSEKIFESFKGKSLSDVLTAHAESQRMLGGSIRLPNEKDTPEQREAKLKDIRTKLGVPESSDKYDLGELPPIHESFKWDDARLNAAKSELHKMGLTNDQAKGVVSLFAKEMSSYFPDNTKTQAEAREQLLQHYGSKPMFERNLNFAHKAVREYGDDELITWLDSTGIGNAPPFVKFMAKLGRELMEHGAVEAASEHDYLSQSDAQAKINEVMGNKSDVYWAPHGTPGREERRKEVEELYKIVAGEM